MSTIHLYSECFAEGNWNEESVVRPSRDIWERWQQEHFGASRLFLRIQHPRTGDDYYCSIGDPIQTDLKNAVFLPMWMIDSNQYDGCGDETIGHIITPDEIPKATRIVLKPVDSLIHQVDVVRCLEQPLSSLGVLQQGKTYLIPLSELGGYLCPVFVDRLEPADVVFLDGDEIPLEFTQAVDYFEPPPRPATPPPQPLPLLNPLVGNMLPEDIQQAFSPDNRVILPRNNAQSGRIQRSHCPSGFVPFSGKGHRLDGAP